MTKSKKVFITNNKKETWELIPQILGKLEDRNVILLEGQLGSGKTTFSQGVLKYLGAKGPFTSPTFVIMKEYDIGKFQIPNSKFQINNKLQSSKFKKAYHLDCYRIDSEGMLDLGWEEIINNKNNLVLVEWPEKIESILSKKYLEINFKILGEKKRGIKINKV